MLFTQSLVKAGLKENPGNHSHTLRTIPAENRMRTRGFTEHGHQAMPVLGQPKFNDYLKARTNYMQIDRQVT